MALLAHALITAEQLIEYLRAAGGGEASRLESVINRATARIESYLDRQVVTRGALTEYHTIPEGVSFVHLRESPIISITSIHESTAGTYDATTLLSAGTGYVVQSTEGAVLGRVNGAAYLLTNWASGYRVVKAVYVAGYQIAAGTGVGTRIPDDIADVAFKLSARLWKEQDRRQWDVSSQSDASGNFTRFGPAALTADMKAQLDAYRLVRFSETGVAA